MLPHLLTRPCFYTYFEINEKTKQMKEIHELIKFSNRIKEIRNLYENMQQ